MDIKMHDMAMEELSMVNGLLKAGSNPRAEKKQAQLVKLIKRLREEAKITGPSIDLPLVSDRT